MGIEPVDSQHKQLVQLAQAVIDGIDEGRGGRIIHQAVAALISYTEYHFRDEEALMVRVGATGITEHKQIHHTLAAQIDEIRNRFIDDEKALALSVREWLVNELVPHILVIDKNTFGDIQKK